MSNIFNRSTGGSPIVDTMLGESYSQVAEVYKNLPLLKDFNDNVNLGDIKENLPVLTNVTQNISTISETLENMDAIKAAPVAAKKAEDSINSAVAQGTSIISEANTVLNEAKETASVFQNTVDTINANMESVKICANEIDAIRDTADSIDNINAVAEYLEDADASISMPIPDLGEIGTETPDFSFEGKTPLEIVAAYIDSLLAIHDNLDSLVKLADDATIPKLLAVATRIENALADTKAQIDALNNTLELFDEKTENFNKLYAEISLEFVQLKNDIEVRRQEILNEISAPVSEAVAAASESKKYREECADSLIKIREVYKLTSEALDTAKETILSDIRYVSDKAMRSISKKADLELDRVSKNLDDIVEDTLTDFNTKLEEVLKDKTDEFDTILAEKIKEVDALIQSKIEEVVEEFKKIADGQLEIIKQEATELFSKLDDTFNDYYSQIVNKGEDILEDITNKISHVYKYKGSVQSLQDLTAFEATAEPGDTYNVVNENGNNYAWTGSKWDSIGAAFVADYGEIS